MQVEIKQLADNQWHTIPLEHFRGRKPGELLASFDGTDTVCEARTEHGVCYLCGKERYMTMMKDKGAVMLCKDVAWFYPDYLEHLNAIIDAFGARGVAEIVPKLVPKLVPECIQGELTLSACNAK